MPTYTVGPNETWYPTEWHELMGLLRDSFGEDSEVCRSVAAHYQRVNFKCGEMERLVRQAVDLNDDGRINLPSWWLLEAGKATT